LVRKERRRDGGTYESENDFAFTRPRTIVYQLIVTLGGPEWHSRLVYFILFLTSVVNVLGLGDEREPVLVSFMREEAGVGTLQRVDRNHVELDPVRVGRPKQWDEHSRWLFIVND
jgi:hypothetical protein